MPTQRENNTSSPEIVSLYSRFADYSSRLPWFERIAFHGGIVSFVIGAAQTEIGNPIQGGIVVLTSGVLCVASTSTTEAREALDNNRDNLL